MSLVVMMMMIYVDELFNNCDTKDAVKYMKERNVPLKGVNLGFKL